MRIKSHPYFNHYVQGYSIFTESVSRDISGIEYNENVVFLWSLRRFLGHEIFFFILKSVDDSMIRYIDKKETIKKQIRNKATAYTSKNNVRDWVLTTYGNACLSCGSKKNIELDHIMPISRGGKNKLSNLQPLCKKCNTSKGAKTEDYR